MKRIFTTFLASVLLMTLAVSCSKPGTAPPAPEAGKQSQSTAMEDSYTGPWHGFTSSFARQDSSQYNNSTLQVRYLANGVVLFEFDIMEGSESGDIAHSFQIPGTMLASESDHTGVYEHLNFETGETLFTINFTLAKDEQQMTVAHTGDVPMDPDGVYEHVGAGVECSEGTARALVENLPTAATSLNSTLGAYTINYPEDYVLNYFYPVTATFDDTGAVLASFLVTDDLSAVWRLDTEDGVPALIFGEGQSMLDQVVYLNDSDEDEDAMNDEAVSLLDVTLEGGTLLQPDESRKLKLDAPYPFPVSFADLLSTDEEIVTVSAEGEIKALKSGTATITGSIVIEDGKRGFSMDITVTGGDLAEGYLLVDPKNEIKGQS